MFVITNGDGSADPFAVIFQQRPGLSGIIAENPTDFYVDPGGGISIEYY